MNFTVGATARPRQLRRSMASLLNKMSRLTATLIFIGLIVGTASAQSTPPLTVSINTDDLVLQRGRGAVVHTTIKWGSVPNAKPETLRSVFLRLAKRGRETRCTRSDCIGATLSLPTPLTPKAGEVVEFDVALNDLYWNDVISSQLDLSQPKNLFDVVPTGTYSLSLFVSFPADYSTKGDRRFVQVASNAVTVELR